ncbi:MAG: cysteine--tRNA ligase [Rhodobacteraceae bacterium]|nr:cysteine--tRNA ligase [Paracoccaceae bacterium]
MADIRLKNSKTRRIEQFEPLDPKNVRMYVCGPTVYDRAHLGNARPVVVFDVLYRLLRHVYGPDHVTYARNITDVDDKIIARAAGRGMAIDALTRTTTAWFHQDMAALGVDYRDDPQFREPRATDYIPQIVSMIETLIARGHAYAAQGHVLFDVQNYGAYGALSGRSVKDMIAGARVEVAPYKRDPMDFVLWKPSDHAQPGWPSPWGRGRPGWHIECSAMSHAVLGDSFDIHGGGIDLQFPHHENEIAQSCCAHPEGEFAKVWIHNEMLQIDGKKMSKSLGNFLTVRDLLDQGVPGEVIRLVFLSTHYSKPMDWTARKVEQAKKVLMKWYQLVRGIRGFPNGPDAGAVVSGVVDDVAHDLNTPKALSRLHHYAEIARTQGTQQSRRRLLSAARFLGLLQEDPTLWHPKDHGLTRFAARLNELRQDAKALKDFSAADAFRSALISAGVNVQMTPVGVELTAGSDFDASKLEDLL